MLGGVCGGLGRRLGVDPGVIRLATVVLATAGGVGIILYGAARLLVPVGPVGIPARPPLARRALAVALIVTGDLILLKAMGLWFADSLTWSVALAAAGSAVVWTRAAEEERDRWRGSMQRVLGEGRLPDLRSVGRIRLTIAGVLFVTGAVTFLIAVDLQVAPDVVMASLVTMIGIGLVVGPWLQQLGRQVGEERRERIRSEERADMAAHLHDSVLQTLALIQRAGSPEEMTRLARGQERELRAWLFGRRPDQGATLLGELITDFAGRVEDRYGVAVEVVGAGDLPLRPDLQAMAEAAGEAMANAAKHAGVARIDVFVEVDAAHARVFVRDEGKGFEQAHVPGDRRGLAESIVGRMRRHGGDAIVQSAPGEGTEIELVLPRTGPEEAAT